MIGLMLLFMLEVSTILTVNSGYHMYKHLEFTTVINKQVRSRGKIILDAHLSTARTLSATHMVSNAVHPHTLE